VVNPVPDKFDRVTTTLPMSDLIVLYMRCPSIACYSIAGEFNYVQRRGSMFEEGFNVVQRHFALSHWYEGHLLDSRHESGHFAQVIAKRSHEK
jgi:hypothetical protein